MPEYRRDPITGRMVIIAAEIAERPHQFDIETPESGNSFSAHSYCPFCEGNEKQTTSEIVAFRCNNADNETNENIVPDTPGWKVRTVPNKYPAVSGRSSEQTLLTAYPSPSPGYGQHEVIIDTPRHILSISEMTEEEVFLMFCMYQERIRHFRNENLWAFVQIFKNVGAAAGASIPHSHSQLIALPFVPPPHTVNIESFESCPYCTLLASELQNSIRIVEETKFSVALCPFASRFAGEVEIYPKRHFPALDFLDNVELRDIALLTQRMVIRLEQEVTWLKGRLAYNLVLHTEPFKESSAMFHTYLSLLPSLARAAGFEWGTGLHINPFPPERTAAMLRRKS